MVLLRKRVRRKRVLIWFVKRKDDLEQQKRV